MMTSRPIKTKSGIYQGDSLSPLVFCLAIAPLSSLLNKSGYGYNNYGYNFSLTRLYPSTPTPQSKPQKSLTNTKTWKSTFF